MNRDNLEQKPGNLKGATSVAITSMEWASQLNQEVENVMKTFGITKEELDGMQIRPVEFMTYVPVCGQEVGIDENGSRIYAKGEPRYFLGSAEHSTSMSRISFGYDMKLRKKVAVKEIDYVLGDDEEFNEAFEREARLMEKLDPEHAVRLVDYLCYDKKN